MTVLQKWLIVAIVAYLVGMQVIPIGLQEYRLSKNLAYRPGDFTWRYLDEVEEQGLQVTEDEDGKPIFRKVFLGQDHMVKAEISPFLFSTAAGAAPKQLKFSDLPSATEGVIDLLVLTAYWFEPCEPAAGAAFSSAAAACRRWGGETAMTRMQIRQASPEGDLPSWQAQYGDHAVDFYLWDDDLDAYWRFRNQFRPR